MAFLIQIWAFGIAIILGDLIFVFTVVGYRCFLLLRCNLTCLTTYPINENFDQILIRFDEMRTFPVTNYMNSNYSYRSSVVFFDFRCVRKIVKSDYPSVRTEQFDSHWKYLHQILNLNIFQKNLSRKFKIH